ncbi:NAD(P)/FAD-dependent oxidoreductase OS=Streptomyces rimosus subsp. rimosus (strain ATCC/ DSM 40260 / JCM 4667 / NRRL 2234) OX=1265868 GN=SRIM_033315 PE=4 SV=1 [Streptomyces rimosus subsp. rimosus]
MTYARFGLAAAQPVALLDRRFRDQKARGLFAGLAAHVIAPLTSPGTAGAAIMFALAAHAGGWPVPRGGSQAVPDALAALLRLHGGVVHTDFEVKRLDDLPGPCVHLRHLADRPRPDRRARQRLSRRTVRPRHLQDRLRAVRPGAVDLRRGPPGGHRAPRPHQRRDRHRAARRRRRPRPVRTVPDRLRPPSLINPTRAPEGKHTFWVYGHVPHGWEGDATEAVERQLERFAPGFRDLVLARAVAGPPQLAARNANYISGDNCAGSAAGLGLVIRPKLARNPYTTAHPAVFLCSQSAPPGPGVHGMAGHHAARAVWRRLRPVR